MTDQEFAYTIAIKRAVNYLNYAAAEIDKAKSVGMQGLSGGAIIVAENEAAILKAALVNALKTV